MESYSDSDTSSESDYESSQGSSPSSDYDEDEPYENLEPELSEPIDEEYNNAPWNPEAQLNATRLAQLHNDIKASAKLPVPLYSKLPRTWPARPFDVRILPDYVRCPIHYFELLWTTKV
jgi:hypothetical protein